jgi:hypothetical protein
MTNPETDRLAASGIDPAVLFRRKGEVDRSCLD